MKIAVFIKEIPNSNNVQIDPKTNNLMRSGEQGRLNPYDIHAVEAALSLKEKYGASVSVITMGPDSFKMSLREALAMGCDDAYLLSSRAFAGSDTLATAYTLSQAVNKIENVDILLFGLKAIDADTGQVPPLVAEDLNISQVTHVSQIINLNKDNNTLDVKRTSETQIETVRTQMPVVISVTNTINSPRYMSPLRIKHIMKEEITVWNEQDLVCDDTRIGMKGSPTIVSSIYIPEEKSRQSQMLEGTPLEAAEQLLNILNEKHILESEAHHDTK